MVGKTNPPLQGNEFKEQRALASSRYEDKNAWFRARRSSDFRVSKSLILKRWSGRVDLNHRPPGPEPGALARLRYAPRFLSPDCPIVYAASPLIATFGSNWPTTRLSKNAFHRDQSTSKNVSI